VQTLAAIVNVPQGGLVVYGSLIGAGIGFLAFVRKYRLPGLALADLIAPSLAVGLALGRIGCLLNGCCYGGPCHLPWAVTFPAGSPLYESQIIRGQITGMDPRAAPDATPRLLHVPTGSAARRCGIRDGDRLVRVDGHDVETVRQARCFFKQAQERGIAVSVDTEAGYRVQLPARSLPVHPTQVYSSVAALLLGFLLWSYYPFRSRDGSVLALMLSVYPIQRIFLEMIRVDEPEFLRTGLSVSQNVSLLLIVGVMGLWWYILRRPKGCALPGTAIGDWPAPAG
jgi:phosphatidylglycerol:prolipoprotein diacylglycerol transferase